MRKLFDIACVHIGHIFITQKTFAHDGLALRLAVLPVFFDLETLAANSRDDNQYHHGQDGGDCKNHGHHHADRGQNSKNNYAKDALNQVISL